MPFGVPRLRGFEGPAAPPTSFLLPREFSEAVRIVWTRLKAELQTGHARDMSLIRICLESGGLSSFVSFVIFVVEKGQIGLAGPSGRRSSSHHEGHEEHEENTTRNSRKSVGIAHPTTLTILKR